MKFFKKKESAPELDLSLIEYIPGASMYCGGDDILMIMLSLQVSIKTLDTIRVLKPKEYQKMVCLVDSWNALLAKNQNWYDEMLKLNDMKEVF